MFQHFISNLQDLLDQFVVVYLDDILIFSGDLVQHTTHVHIVLERLYQYGLYAKLEKRTFNQTSAKLLGFILSLEGFKMDLCKVQAFPDWAAPH